MAVEMLLHTETNIQIHYDYKVIGEKFVFGEEQDFRLAFRMTRELDPDYGNLIVMQNTQDENGLKHNMVPSRPCTSNDFNTQNNWIFSDHGH